MPEEALDEEATNEAAWTSALPKFEAWIKSLSEKSLYKHLLESLNHTMEDEGGTELIRDLTEFELDWELSQLDSDSDSAED